jgi:hypothetical protein
VLLLAACVFACALAFAGAAAAAAAAGTLDDAVRARIDAALRSDDVFPTTDDVAFALRALLAHTAPPPAAPPASSSDGGEAGVPPPPPPPPRVHVCVTVPSVHRTVPYLRKSLGALAVRFGDVAQHGPRFSFEVVNNEGGEARPEPGAHGALTELGAVLPVQTPPHDTFAADVADRYALQYAWALERLAGGCEYVLVAEDDALAARNYAAKVLDFIAAANALAGRGNWCGSSCM